MGFTRPKPICRVQVRDLQTNKTWNRTVYENKVKTANEVIELIKKVIK